MKRLLVMLLLLSVASSVELTKEVLGSKVLDLNETLDVKLVISSPEKIRVYTLLDPVPSQFVAIAYPSFCRFEPSRLLCTLNTTLSGELEVNYKLLAVERGFGMIGPPQLIYEGGVKTTNFFREFFVGKPKISLEIKAPEQILLGDIAEVSVILSNLGLFPANGTLEIKAPGITLSKNVTLNGGEVITESFSINSSKGFFVNASFRWKKEERKSKLVRVVFPGLKVKRKLRTRWISLNGTLKAFVESIIFVENNGSAPGNYTYCSESCSSFILNPGEVKEIRELYENCTKAVKVFVYDEKGRFRGFASFSQECVKKEPDFWAVLYPYAKKVGPIKLAVLFLLFLVIAPKVRKKDIRFLLYLLAVLTFILLLDIFMLEFSQKVPVSLTTFLGKQISNLVRSLLTSQAP